MTARTPLVLVVSCALFASPPLSAASKVWSRLPGPGGGPVDGLAVDPSSSSILYATSGSDAFKSTNQGTSWSRVDSGGLDLGGGVAIDLGNPSIVLSGRGRSTNGGQSWSSSFYYRARRIRFASSAPGLVYAVGPYLYRSVDSGATWTTLGWGDLTSLAPSPGDPLTLLAGTPGGVVKSTDGGVSFAQPQLSPFGIVDLAWGAPGIALAATAQDGVFRSTDGGASWTPASAGLPSLRLSSIAMAAGAPLAAYAGTVAGIARSTDGGLTWSSATSFAVGPTQLVAPSSSELYAAGSFGLLLSSDSAGTFQPRDDGLGSSKATAILFDPLGVSTLLATSPHGVHRSTDGGGSWAATLTVPGQEFRTLSSGGSRLWTGSNGAGVYATTDGGQTWGARNAGLPTRDVTALAAAPTDPTRALVSLSSSGVFRTTDGGATWGAVLAANDEVTALAFSPMDPQVAVAGTSPADHRILKSTDGGQSFAPVFPSSYGGASWITFDPANPQKIFVLGQSSDGAHTEDGGTSWQIWRVYPQGGLAFDPTTPDHAYIASSDYIPVLKSVDGGLTFLAYSPGLDSPYSSGAPAAIAFDPATPHRLVYAGESGLWEILDGPMQLTSCAPTAALSTGGTPVRLTGTNLPVSGFVGFDGNPYLPFSGGDGLHVDLVTPSHAPGLVTVTLSNGTQERVGLPAALTFIGVVPALTSVLPSAVSEGATVHVRGTGFGPGTRFSLDRGYGYRTDLQVLSRTESDVDLEAPALGDLLPPATYDLVAENPVGLVARASNALQLLDVRPTYGFYTAAPCRALDTRLPPFVALPPRGTFPIIIGCGVPAGAVAVAANVTVTQANGSGTLRVSGEFPIPEPGTVAFSPGQTRANNAILKVATDTAYQTVTVNVLNDSNATVHAIIDVSGYFR